MCKLFDHKTFVAEEMEKEKQFIESTNRNNIPTLDAQSSKKQNNNGSYSEPHRVLQEQIRAKFNKLLKEENKTNDSSTACNSI